MDEVRHNDIGNEIMMVKRRDAAAPGATPGPLLRAITGTFPAAVQPQTTK